MSNKNKRKKNKRTRKKRGGNYQCAVCLEDGLQDDDNTIRLSCGHFFCKNCIRGWLVSNNTCPNCRREVSQEDRNRVGGLEQYPANLFNAPQIDDEIDDVWDNDDDVRWFYFANNDRWINSDDPHNQFGNDVGGWVEDGIYVPHAQAYRGGIVSLIHNPRARDNFIIVNYNGNQYRVIGAKVRQYYVPGSSNIHIDDEGGGPEEGHIVYEKISRISKAIGFINRYASEDDWWEALRTPVTEEDILNDINVIPNQMDGIDFININDIQEHFNWNKVYSEEERLSIYLRWRRKLKREENREQNLQRADENRRRRTRNRGRHRCPANLPNCNIQGGGKRKKKTRKKRGGFLNWFVQRDSDTNNMNLVVSNKSKRKSIYGEPHPLRKYIVDPRDNDDFDEDRTDGFSISFPFFGGRKKKGEEKEFLYNPNDPSKSFDVYIDKNPNDTIPIKYTTVKDVEDTIKKLERLYKTKKYPHKRIWQVGMIMKVRLEAMNKYKKTRYPNAKNVFKRFQLSKRYFKFLGERSKKKSFEDRKKMTFNIKMRKTRKGGGKKKNKKTRKKGGVKVTKSPRKKTAIEIHREKLNNPEFKKRLFANKDTKVQIFEKAARKIHANRVNKMLDDFKQGYEDRFGKLNEDDKKVLDILKQNIKDKSKITFKDISYVKEYRKKSQENNAKATYIYTTFKEMKRRSELMSSEARRKREGLRVLDEQESDTGTTGEIAFLQEKAEEGHGGLEYLPPTKEHPYGVFHKTSIYPGNLGKKSPILFVDAATEKEVEMPTEEFDKYLFKRGGRRKKKRKTRRRKNKRKNKTKKNKSTKKMDKDFKPNLTPRQMFTMGSFGGTYWRPIKSKFYNTTLKNKHKKYSFLKDLPDNIMTKPFDEYDVKLNKYKKKVGTTLKFWENKGWMKESHPYGWVQWYCDYYSGKRSADDARQIKRWQQLAGPNGRFRKWLITMIMKKGGKDKWDDYSISPAIRQTLQHWGYKLTKKDFENELKNRKK